ncbi:MAG TPA: hypothetical protein VHV55_27995 [Pirellulales bacterium]|jgi:hypothetical protein|nr:hypothetical protein [Pirellulales bacterium]
MQSNLKPLTDFLVGLGIEAVLHTGKNYLAHLTGVHQLMRSYGLDHELCRAGLFHSIYGTQQFQGFKLELQRRPELESLIDPRAERLAFWNCLMDRSSFDGLLAQADGPYLVRNRETGEIMSLTRGEFDDLACVHLFDWLEQVRRSSLGWGYRRAAYQRMAERAGTTAQRAYEAVFSMAPTPPQHDR